MLDLTLATHISAGGTGILSGFTALYASKGQPVHRRAGMVFVFAMLTMSIIGALMAALRGVAPESNIQAGVLTAYYVLTSLATVRPITGWSRRLDIALMLVALTLGTADIVMGVQAVTSANTKIHWLIVPFSLFGVMALLAGIGDARMIRAGGLQGAKRLARHLWRMCWALFIAAGSFFLGQAKVIPKPIRIFPLLALPVIAVLVTMAYWLWRVRVKRSMRSIVLTGAANVERGARPPVVLHHPA